MRIDVNMFINTERWADRSRCLCSGEIYFSKWKHKGAGVALESLGDISVFSLGACSQSASAAALDGFSSSIKSCLRPDSAWISPWNRGLHSKGHLEKLEWTFLGAHISVCSSVSASVLGWDGIFHPVIPYNIWLHDFPTIQPNSVFFFLHISV